MNKDRLQHLRTLCSNATPGPWSVQVEVTPEDYDGIWDKGVALVPETLTEDTSDGDCCNIPTATFIAEARTALPEALDYIAVLTETNRLFKIYIEALSKTVEELGAENKKLAPLLEKSIMLAQRVHELEAQVAALEAKRLELEGKE
jgi:hypothetical protein